MNRTFSVYETSQMLNVNEETVRRWIRDKKLHAQRSVGRIGNAIQLEDIVTFANTPPRAYLLSLDIWLMSNNIPFERVEDPKTFTPSERTKILASLATGSAAGTIASTVIPTTLATGPAGLVTGVVGLGVAGIAYGATKAKRKLYQTYTIKLFSSNDAEHNAVNIAAKAANNTENRTNALPTPSINEANNKSTAPASHEAQSDTPLNEDSRSFTSLTSILEEITQAKQLLDAGIITTDEFAEIKAKLIAKI